MTNKSFGKLENGALYYAPLPLVINGENIWTNIEKIYKDCENFFITTFKNKLYSYSNTINL